MKKLVNIRGIRQTIEDNRCTHQSTYGDCPRKCERPLVRQHLRGLGYLK